MSLALLVPVISGVLFSRLGDPGRQPHCRTFQACYSKTISHTPTSPPPTHYRERGRFSILRKTRRNSVEKLMAARPGPGDQDRRNNGWLGASDAVAAPYDGYARNEAGNERAYQNYPPLHNQSNPSLSTSQSNLSMKKNETMVSERYVTRTPSPTPSEQAFLERKGVVDWKKISNWRFWARREWICTFIRNVDRTDYSLSLARVLCYWRNHPHNHDPHQCL